MTMPPQFWLAIGGVLGATIRALFKSGLRNWTGEMWAQIAVGGIGMALLPFVLQVIPFVGNLVGLPTIPPEALARVLDAMADPWTALPGGAALVYLGIDLDWVLRRSKRNGSSPGTTSSGVKAGLVLLVVALGAAGCASLGLQRSTVSVPKDQLLLDYGDAKADYRLIEHLFLTGCAAGTIPEPVCQAGAPVRLRAQAFDARIREAVVAKQELNLQDLRGLFSAAAALARLAGYPVPTLGAPR